jgi:hypothetical protein
MPYEAETPDETFALEVWRYEKRLTRQGGGLR